MLDVQTIPLLTLPSVPFARRRGLPRCAAIYFVLNGQDTILYIGRSVNLAERWSGSRHHQAANLAQHGATRLSWLVMDDAALLTGVEDACIAYFDPVCNGKYDKAVKTLHPQPITLRAVAVQTAYRRADVHTLDAPLPLQVRLEPHHLAALDGARVVTDPASGLTVTLSRQQVLLGILDQWIAAQEPEPRAVTATVTATEAPQAPARKRTRQAAPAD